MGYSVTCSCGKNYPVGPDAIGKRAKCPNCGRVKRIPWIPTTGSSGSGRAAPIWWGAAAVLLAAAGALTWLVVTNLPADESRGPELAAASTSPSRDKTNSEKLDEPDGTDDAHKHSSLAVRGDPAMAELLPPPRVLESATEIPPVRIARVEPAEPQAGSTFTVHLQGASPGNVRYEFRTDPEQDWQPAVDGRAVVSGVKAGPLTLEVRAVDGQGNVSPITRHVLAVGPGTVTAKPEGPPPKPAVRDSEPGRVQAKWKEGDRFYQEVVMIRKPTYRLLGEQVQLSFQCTFVSSFKVEQKNADGGMVVQQKVESARLNSGDVLIQSFLGEAIQQAQGMTFKITLDPQMRVTKLEGYKDAVKMSGNTLLGAQAFTLFSVLDEDGWKELTQATFFLPSRPLRNGEKWEEKMEHDWGPLGRWTGKVAYLYSGKQGGIHKLVYVRNMTHAMPKEPPAGTAFRISKADFKPQEAGGVIYFDGDKNRVVAAEETFRVKGTLVIADSLLNGPVEIDEEQVFRIRVLDRNPAQPPAGNR